MQAPTRADSPHIPLRTAGWPVRRSPRWLIAALAALAVIGAAVGLAHRPTAGQRATDLRGFLHTLTADVGSCAAGVRESLGVLHAIDTGASRDVGTAISEASYGAANCSPANNELLGDLTGAQVPESLASYHLQTAITALIDWAAPDAQAVMTDVATVLAARVRPGRAADLAALRRDLRRLDAQRAVVYSALGPAIRTLSPHSPLPILPG
jgi:hypothetical protein